MQAKKAKRALILRQVERPKAESPEEIANALFNALGIGSSEEEVEMLRKIAEASMLDKGITSKDLSRELKMPRTTVIYKLNYFIDLGLVVRKGRQYFMRSASLQDTLEDIQLEMQAEFNRLMKLAEKFDELIEREIYGRRERKRE